ncbi:MAG: radical SAM protein, partial [Deltaproteobacteria bacterium]
MLNADINIGKACNNRCRFCSNENPTPAERRWARPEQVREEIELNWKKGARSIGFLGGEPCLYPNLERVIAHARQIGYERISICTNGQLLADRKLLDRLVGAGLTRVAVSIHSHSARLEDYITRRPGSFRAKIDALKNLVRARDTAQLPDGLSLNTVLHGKNVESLREFALYM